ncbi:Pyridoxine/pyridoxamine 5'-phosphate oxidase [Pseudobythopirellula maris]|uniref:Pyridoxine/pyridoxamine 5'-phosphate oxidase n=1 Tax=Pseudobythopirellula maris TaxID=2527991 RepID=A0A5C5ZLJ2_9BACT|nr:pyridoxamine 5'-phosphate oxidase [Pseudobythopirellula maris]TWT88324.1 Pyridoxine/pyridoxamine 5'-phosphate oxidase [Pseudobythopirellula maris]
MSFAEMRKNYMLHGLNEADCDASPFAQFEQWIIEASDQKPGDWFEVNAMTLSTASNEGAVSSRQVLLKGFDTEGFVFYTNYSSQKGSELAENPRAALNFFWPHIERQVRAEGVVTKTDRELSSAYFHSRPRESQLGAIVSDQSSVIESRQALEEKYAAAEREHKDVEIPLPDTWGGYRVAPTMFEFWQGRVGRLHDRLRYTLEEGEWVLRRVAP